MCIGFVMGYSKLERPTIGAPLKGDVTKLMLFALLTSLSPAIGSLIGIEIVSSKRS